MKKNNHFRTLLLITVAASALSVMTTSKADTQYCNITTYNVDIHPKPISLYVNKPRTKNPYVTQHRWPDTDGPMQFAIHTRAIFDEGRVQIKVFYYQSGGNCVSKGTYSRRIHITFGYPDMSQPSKRSTVFCSFTLHADYASDGVATLSATPHAIRFSCGPEGNSYSSTYVMDVGSPCQTTGTAECPQSLRITKQK
jgi:hypothetical protein